MWLIYKFIILKYLLNAPYKGTAQLMRFPQVSRTESCLFCGRPGISIGNKQNNQPEQSGATEGDTNLNHTRINLPWNICCMITPVLCSTTFLAIKLITF